MSLISSIKFPLPDGGFYDTSLNVSANVKAPVGTEELCQQKAVSKSLLDKEQKGQHAYVFHRQW